MASASKEAFLQHLRLRASIILRRFNSTQQRSFDRWRELINAYLSSVQGTLDMARAARASGLTMADLGCFGMEAPYDFGVRNGRLVQFGFHSNTMWRDYRRGRKSR